MAWSDGVTPGIQATLSILTVLFLAENNGINIVSQMQQIAYNDSIGYTKVGHGKSFRHLAIEGQEPRKVIDNGNMLRKEVNWRPGKSQKIPMAHLTNKRRKFERQITMANSNDKTTRLEGTLMAGTNDSGLNFFRPPSWTPLFQKSYLTESQSIFYTGLFEQRTDGTTYFHHWVVDNCQEQFKLYDASSFNGSFIGCDGTMYFMQSKLNDTSMYEWMNVGRKDEQKDSSSANELSALLTEKPVDDRTYTNAVGTGENAAISVSQSEGTQPPSASPNEKHPFQTQQSVKLLDNGNATKSVLTTPGSTTCYEMQKRTRIATTLRERDVRGEQILPENDLAQIQILTPATAPAIWPEVQYATNTAQETDKIRATNANKATITDAAGKGSARLPLSRVTAASLETPTLRNISSDQLHVLRYRCISERAEATPALHLHYERKGSSSNADKRTEPAQLIQGTRKTNSQLQTGRIRTKLDRTTFNFGQSERSTTTDATMQLTNTISNVTKHHVQAIEMARTETAGRTRAAKPNMPNTSASNLDSNAKFSHRKKINLLRAESSSKPAPAVTSNPAGATATLAENEITPKTEKIRVNVFFDGTRFEVSPTSFQADDNSDGKCPEVPPAPLQVDDNSDGECFEVSPTSFQADDNSGGKCPEVSPTSLQVDDYSDGKCLEVSPTSFQVHDYS